MSIARIFTLTLLAMIAFASNSLLCRAALKQGNIDAATFTFVRIFSGAVALWLLINVRRRVVVDRTVTPLAESFSGWPLVIHYSSLRYGNWISALALFAYAAGFSFAYTALSAGTGGLMTEVIVIVAYHFTLFPTVYFSLEKSRSNTILRNIL
jgi:hypothetical protein